MLGIISHATIVIAADRNRSGSGFLGPYNTPLPEFHGDNVGPHGRRAWTVQDEVLARRYVSFGPREPTWRCSMRECCACEHPRSAEPVKWTKERWRTELVPEFSRRDLTYEADRLIALGALAQLFSTVTGVEYVCGLWKSDLLYDLLWCVVDPQHSSRANTYVAPTWSWASINGGASYSGLDGDPDQKHRSVIYEYDAVVNDCHATYPEGSGAYGLVEEALLLVDGYLAPTRHVQHDEFEVTFPSGDRNHTLNAHCQLDIAGEAQLQREIYFLPILTITTESKPNLWGLLLTHEQTAYRGYYTRIGRGVIKDRTIRYHGDKEVIKIV